MQNNATLCIFCFGKQLFFFIKNRHVNTEWVYYILMELNILIIPIYIFNTMNIN